MRALMRALVLVGLAGCASFTGERADPHPELEPFLGAYRGGFDSARTPTPDDDLNHNPCPEPADRPCEVHHAPLDDVLLALERNSAGEVVAAFFWNEDDLERDRPLDLLGRGCGTRIGAITGLRRQTGDSGSYLIATFPIEADNRLCLGKLRPVSRHHLDVELHPEPGGNAALARVVIDRSLRDDNYMYVEEDGVRRRVRIDLANTVERDHERRYRVCIEDEYGEYTRCVLTDRELRSFALPIPVPGGVAVNYTWWEELKPRLKRTSGRYLLEQYVGVFEPVSAAGSP
ncbi:MAG TPA: hypothetical protein VF210_22080 [Pseudomonadales bacterium]